MCMRERVRVCVWSVDPNALPAGYVNEVNGGWLGSSCGEGCFGGPYTDSMSNFGSQSAQRNAASACVESAVLVVLASRSQFVLSVSGNVDRLFWPRYSVRSLLCLRRLHPQGRMLPLFTRISPDNWV